MYNVRFHIADCLPVLLSAIVLLCSCSESTNVQKDEVVPADTPIGFTAYLSRSTTRAYTGTADNQLTLSNLQSSANGSYGDYGFGVFAYHTGTTKYNQATPPEFMYNQQVTYQDDKWQYSPMKYWPNGYGEAEGNKGSVAVYTSFFAYAPYSPCIPHEKVFSTDRKNMTNICIADCTGAGETGNPYVCYRICDDPMSDQVDLCYAAPLLNQQKQTVDGNLNFTFNHALAGLRVTIDSRLNHPVNTGTVDDESGSVSRVYVRSVSFEGFATEGMLNLNSPAGSPSWYGFYGTEPLGTAPVVLNDCLLDGQEAIVEDTDEFTFVGNGLLNPAVTQRGGLTTQPGVTGTPVSLFGSYNSYTSASPDFPLFVIPNGAPLKVTITYDVETQDPSLASDLLSDRSTPGSSIANTITKTIQLNGKDLTLQSGKTYTVNLHLGMSSVDFDAKVSSEWEQNMSVPVGTLSYQYSVSTNQGATWGSWSATKPSWLTVTTTGNPAEFVFTTTNSTSTTTLLDIVQTSRNVTGDATLKSKPSVTNVDLSMVNNDGTARETMTTANCYLVHAPGTYKLPLVYGNAIKEGAKNELAYKSNTANNSNKRNVLVNHADQEITDPWLKNNGATPDGARLVREDVKGMISSVGISDDYLTFEVDADNIATGNAVIAATKEGTVVWSWHIWVTAQTLSDLTSIDTGEHTDLKGNSAPYKVAPVNVGQIEGSVGIRLTYAGEWCKIRVTGDDGVSMEFMAKAKDYQTSAVRYNPCPYYQWGRKDAIITFIGGYDADGKAMINPGSEGGVSTIGSTIQNPRKTFYHEYSGSNNGPYNEGKYNYWDMNNAKVDNVKTATVKTIYDPCPPGFCIPTSNLYYYIVANSSGWSSWLSPSGRKWTVNDKSVFFPAASYRSGGGGLGVSSGNAWSATPVWSRNSYALGISSDGVNVGNHYRTFGFTIRPVVEE